MPKDLNVNLKKKIHFILYRIILTLSFLLISFSSISQNFNTKDSLTTKQVIDSLILDRDLNNWSIRLYTNIKAQHFKLSNNEASLNFTPNNPYGVGIGVATKKIILDIGYNLKNRRKEETDRFDLMAGFFLNKNILDFYVQVYKGFNIKNSIDENQIFRDDIKSTAIGIDYLYLVSRKDFSTQLLRTGLADQNQNIFSFGVGAFAIYNRISADKSIVPETYYPNFNEQSRIKNFTNYGVGVMGGMVGVFKLPSNFYFAASAKFGLGIALKNIDSENFSYDSETSIIYKLNAAALVGYRWKRFYANFNISGSNYWTKIGFGNNGQFGIIRSKIALGYMLRSRKKH